MNKKFLAFVAPAILTLPIIFCASLAGCSIKDNDPQNGGHTTHSFVYTDESDTQHKKTCRDCDDVNELEGHVYDDDYDETCNFCTHTRIAPKYSAASRVTISADKTEIKAGDTFTLTIEIECTRTDMNWRAIDFVVGPLLEDGTASKELADNFEIVGRARKATIYDEEAENGWSDLVPKGWTNLTFYDSEGVHVVLAIIDAGKDLLNATRNIKLTVELKVMDTAIIEEPLTFGVYESDFNYVEYCSDTYKETTRDSSSGVTTVDKVKVDSGNVGLASNQISMKITANAD